ncbi:MAG: PAS domain-containing protein, partial [Rubrivivax sp.]
MATKSSPSSPVANALVVAAIERTMPIIEFSPDGTILRANDHFLAAVGYTLKEIQGKHHRLFVKGEDAAKPEYQNFWAGLAAGTAQSGRFPRLAKDGTTIWLEASYTPVLDGSGKTLSVIKVAHDITEDRRLALANEAKLTALERSTAVIEFDPKGNILQANALFLAAVGYVESEVVGQHHRMFLTPEYQKSAEYAGFWRALAAGELKSGRVERVTKGGKSVWLEATYNPIFDLEGRVVRVVKFATDITEKVEAARITEAALDKAREAERIREELDRTLQE